MKEFRFRILIIVGAIALSIYLLYPTYADFQNTKEIKASTEVVKDSVLKSNPTISQDNLNNYISYIEDSIRVNNPSMKSAREKRIKLGSLNPTRDFNYIDDTVRGFIAVAESDRSIGEVINIGSNYEIPIGETAKLISEVMGVDIVVETDEQRIRPENSEVERLWADNSKAKRLTGWEPQYGGRDGFKRGLKETVSWFTNPDNLKKYKADIYNL